MHYYLLLPLFSLLPVIAAILITRPLWKMRELSNETIQGLGLLVMLGGMLSCLILIFHTPELWIGSISLLFLFFNLKAFKIYERKLHTTRCPQCRTRHLQIRRINSRIFQIYCHHCGFCDEWRR